MNLKLNNIPDEVCYELEKAVRILKDEGCGEIFVFGSLLNGRFGESSDIDIAVKGLKPNKFFKTFGRLMVELKLPFDLIDLDEGKSHFNKMLLDKGALLRVA